LCSQAFILLSMKRGRVAAKASWRDKRRLIRTPESQYRAGTGKSRSSGAHLSDSETEEGPMQPAGSFGSALRFPEVQFLDDPQMLTIPRSGAVRMSSAASSAHAPPQDAPPAEGPVPSTPPRRPRPDYTPSLQYSPAMRKRKGGARRLRFARLGKTARGWDASDILTKPAGEVVKYMNTLGFFPEFTIPECEKCADAGKSSSPKPVDISPLNLGWRCRCGVKTSFRSTLSESEAEQWLPKVPIRKQLAGLWMFSFGHSPEAVSHLLGLELGGTVMHLFRTYIDTVAQLQETANSELRVGGDGVEVEADEVALRALPAVKDDEPGVWWVRYFGMARRGSTKMFLEPLEDRWAARAGQGGGGALAISELERVLRVGSDNPTLIAGSILHTDSAKAYKRVGPMVWPEAGAHHADFETKEPFKKHGYTHTNVTHKKKVGQPMQFVALRKVTLRSGVQKDVLGGTEKVDGFWAYLRRWIGKLSVNTGTNESEQRVWFRKRVRAVQWQWWNLHRNRFSLLGEAFVAKRNVLDF
jgi:hypothetical protein